jgi:hypothetical protein
VMCRPVALGLALGISLSATALAPASSSDVVRWSALRRPLHLPVVAPGSRCPVSHVDRRVPWSRIRIFGGSGIGTGPVYPGLGAASGLMNATKDAQYGSQWQGQKVFWYVAPSYRGRVLIRGRRIDGSGWLGFNGMRVPSDELRIEPYDTVSWSGQPRFSRGIPSAVRALSSGCYAVQVDGKTFSKIVVFQVDLAS